MLPTLLDFHFTKTIPRLRPQMKSTILNECHAFRTLKLPARTGVMALKKFPLDHWLADLFRGMTALWDAKGNRLPVTILQISRAQVVSVKTLPKHGYWAVQVGI